MQLLMGSHACKHQTCQWGWPCLDAGHEARTLHSNHQRAAELHSWLGALHDSHFRVSAVLVACCFIRDGPMMHTSRQHNKKGCLSVSHACTSLPPLLAHPFATIPWHAASVLSRPGSMAYAKQMQCTPPQVVGSQACIQLVNMLLLQVNLI